MADVKGRVLVITTGKELLDEMAPSMSGRGLELVCVPTLKYAAARLATGDCSAMVVDFVQVPPTEREDFLNLHKQFPKVHLFTLESIASLAPAVDSPLRRLSWPLPMGFADQVRPARVIETIFATG